MRSERDEVGPVSGGGGMRYEFNLEKYRPGVPVLRDWGGIMSEGVREAYRGVPPVVWWVAKRLYVTGTAGTVAQMRAQLRFKLQRDVGEDLIALYFAENAEELEAEREAFLEQLHRASLEQELAMGANPALERYHRVAANLGVVLDAMVGDIIDEGRTVSPAEVKTLTRTLKELQEADPMVSAAKFNPSLPSPGGVKGGESSGAGLGDDKVDEMLQAMMDMVQKGGGAEADERLAEYEKRNKIPGGGEKKEEGDDRDMG